MRKETMSGIWRSPEVKPKWQHSRRGKLLPARRTLFQNLCCQTERNSREGVVFISDAKTPVTRAKGTGRVDASSSSSATSELARTRIRGRSQSAATKEIRSRSKELAEHDRDEFATVCFPLLVRGPLGTKLRRGQRPGRSVARIDHRSDEGVPAPSITLALSLGGSRGLPVKRASVSTFFGHHVASDVLQALARGSAGTSRCNLVASLRLLHDIRGAPISPPSHNKIGSPSPRDDQHGAEADKSSYMLFHD